MNKIEFVLGATVFLSSILSILFVNFGVVPSRFYPGHYTYSGLAYLSNFYLFPLLLIAGFIAFMHGIYRSRFLELGLGIISILWGSCTWLWVSLNLYDGISPYIKSFPTSITETWLPIVLGIFLGIALMLDGTRRKTLPLSKITNQNV